MRFLKRSSVLERKSLNRNLSWGFPLGNLLSKTRVLKHRVLERKRRPNANASVLGTQCFRTLRLLCTKNLSGTESRIARCPESQTWNRQKLRSEENKNESNRSEVESRKIDSESPSESRPIQCLKRPWNHTILNRSILDSQSPIQYH